jgi:hypothetical protein
MANVRKQTKQTDVLDGLDVLSDRSIRKLADSYGEAVSGRIVELLESLPDSGSPEGILRALGPGLVRALDPSVVAEELWRTLDQAAGIGAVTASRKESNA